MLYTHMCIYVCLPPFRRCPCTYTCMHMCVMCTRTSSTLLPIQNKVRQHFRGVVQAALLQVILFLLQTVRALLQVSQMVSRTHTHTVHNSRSHTNTHAHTHTQYLRESDLEIQNRDALVARVQLENKSLLQQLSGMQQEQEDMWADVCDVCWRAMHVCMCRYVIHIYTLYIYIYTCVAYGRHLICMCVHECVILCVGVWLYDCV